MDRFRLPSFTLMAATLPSAVNVSNATRHNTQVRNTILAQSEWLPLLHSIKCHQTTTM